MTTYLTESHRRALVAGGTRRVGRWLSETLLEDGWRVLAAFRQNDQAAQDFQTEMQLRHGPQSAFEILRADLADFAEAQRAADAAAGAGGTLDLLACSTGQALTASLGETSPQQFEALWRSNLQVLHNLVLASLPRLRLAPGGGHIIVFSVVGAGQRAFRDIPAYAACKAMVESYTRSFARELAREGLRVNCIALGITTLQAEGVPEIDPDRLPAGKAVGQADLAALLRYLLHSESQQLTGAVLPLSGGFGL